MEKKRMVKKTKKATAGVANVCLYHVLKPQRVIV